MANQTATTMTNESANSRITSDLRKQIQDGGTRTRCTPAIRAGASPRIRGQPSDGADRASDP